MGKKKKKRKKRKSKTTHSKGISSLVKSLFGRYNKIYIERQYICETWDYQGEFDYLGISFNNETANIDIYELKSNEKLRNYEKAQNQFIGTRSLWTKKSLVSFRKRDILILDGKG